MNRHLVFELATARFIERREDALFLGRPGTGKSHLAQAIGHAAIQQGHRVLYREAHVLLEELADATLDGSRKEHMTELGTVALIIIDDLGMRKLPATAAEDLLEIIMRRYERASTLLTSNRPVEDWGKLLGDTASRHRDARPAAAPRPRPEVRPAELAHQEFSFHGGGVMSLGDQRPSIPCEATSWRAGPARRAPRDREFAPLRTGAPPRSSAQAGGGGVPRRSLPAPPRPDPKGPHPTAPRLERQLAQNCSPHQLAPQLPPGRPRSLTYDTRLTSTLRSEVQTS